MKENEGCKCNTCKSACKHKPGWFMPEEAEKVAEYLGISLQELFKTKLSVDWWQSECNIFLLSPAIPDYEGREFPGNPRGQCAFYKNKLCSIHLVKPFECRKYMHDVEHDESIENHEAVSKAWDNEKCQQQIRDLLGSYPVASDFGMSDIFGGMFG